MHPSKGVGALTRLGFVHHIVPHLVGAPPHGEVLCKRVTEARCVVSFANRHLGHGEAYFFVDVGPLLLHVLLELGELQLKRPPQRRHKVHNT